MNLIARFVDPCFGDRKPLHLRQELLSDIFRATARSCPDQVALICQDQTLSYAQLDRRSDAFAAVLRAQNIGPGQFVGLWCERSLDLHIALLGIVKSGATYIPFDADAPLDRIGVCLDDCNATALVIDAITGTKAASLSIRQIPAHNIPTLLQTPPAEFVEGADSVLNDDFPAQPQDLAYAIYTSGSTGKPKAVGITHANICHYLRAANDVFNLNTDDIVFQGASVAFDLSLEEIFLPYMVGATLWVPTRQILAETDQLADVMDGAGITVLDTVPTLLGLLPRDISTLRVIILGGEVCPPHLAEQWLRPGRRLFNSYGPTEATVVATVAEILPDQILSGQTITIGRPVANMSCYVVGEDLTLVPPGAEGELLIGGPGVAPGYLGRPDLTAQKFIANPFDGNGLDPVLYRTGDAVIIDEQGNLVFKGRIDDQVKIRGFRVELGEIEARLASLPAIAQAAVVLRHDGEFDQLVAFLVPNPDCTIDSAQIRAQLLQQMPAYMVPTHFETLSVLPRLSSGKADRKSLAALALTEMVVDALQCEAPQTETEALLLDAAKTIFPGQPIGFDDDFFTTLGGHSLSAAKFVSLVRKTPGLAHATLQNIYTARTLRALGHILGDIPLDASRKPSLAFDPPPLMRRLLCGLAQALVLPIILGVATAPWLGVFVSYMLLSGDDINYTREVISLLVTYSLITIGTVVVAICVKWLVLGKTKPGRYPLWGVYYFRWWVAQRFLGLVRIKWFQDSPVIRVYMRLLGAKVGSGAIIGEVESGALDLVSIGANTTIGGRVRLASAEVIGNELVIAPIAIGHGVSIGTSSVVGQGCTIGDWAELADLTALPPGSIVGPAECWKGSPARRDGSIDIDSLPEAATSSTPHKMAMGLAHGIALLLLPPLTLIPIFPAFHLMDRMTDLLGAMFGVNYLTYLPLVAWPTAMVMIAVTVALIIMVRWTILPSVRVGTYSVHSWFFFRKWMVSLCTELTLDSLSSLYATVYMRWLYRLMGARIGRDSELSTSLSGRYDLITVGENCFIADDVMLGEEACRQGWITLEPVVLGDRVFIGNDAVVPAGSEIISDSLIGIKSLTPPASETRAKKGIWFGSPPMAFPVRQTFDEIGTQWTYSPPRWKRVARAVFEAFSVSFPSMLFITLGTYAVEALTPAITSHNMVRIIPQFLAAGTVVSIALVVIAAGMKWLLMGKYKPTVKPMWSWWALRSEAIAVLYWGLAGNAMLDHLCGSPFLPMAMRLFGAKIGKGVFLDTTDITEFDCVSVGDFCAINTTSALQTHLYEDRVMKVGRVQLGKGITVGANSTVLYDTHIGDFARIGPLTIIMKGESLPEHTAWAGAPAQPVTSVTQPPIDAPLSASAPDSVADLVSVAEASVKADDRDATARTSRMRQAS